VREAIELPFGTVSRVGPDIGVLDRCPHSRTERGCFRGFSGPLVLTAFWSSFVTEKCIRLVHEMFITFPFGQ